ncbi:MAG: HEAT repeat domain-containing protein [Anaerolineae bacterium]|nr:HEAT repeat domain-containing protein [Anaerolineae bacterium]
MLDEADQINWERLGFHVYGKHEQIPQSLRDLLSPDPETREYARGFLLGSGQDHGDIYDTTPHIIPFLLELLAREDTPGKEELLLDLSGVAEYIFFHRYSKPLSVHMMRLCVQTYEAFKSGIDNLIDLLAHAAKPVQLNCAVLLQYMTDDVETLIPALIERVHHEPDEEVRVALLGSLKTLLSSLEWPHYALKAEAAPFLRELVENDPAHTIRVAAARASVETLNPYTYRTKEDDRLSPQVPALLTREFWERRCPMHYYEQEKTLHRQQIVRDLSWLKPEPLIELLNHPDLSPEDAHLVARGLLAHTFLWHGGNRSHWHIDVYPDWDNSSYTRAYPAAGNLAIRGFRNDRQMLQTIVDADKVWEAPTNLFSYFYGLPDSREELRALLDKLRASDDRAD